MGEETGTEQSISSIGPGPHRAAEIEGCSQSVLVALRKIKFGNFESTPGASRSKSITMTLRPKFGEIHREVCRRKGPADSTFV